MDQVTGIDNMPKAVERVQSIAKRMNLHIHTQVLELQNVCDH